MLPVALTPPVKPAAISKELLEHVDRRRRQIEVHSIIYYKFHKNLVADSLFDHWCRDLVYLQRVHPALKKVGYKPDLFADFTGDTGMHLTSDLSRYPVAEWLIEYHERTQIDA